MRPKSSGRVLRGPRTGGPEPVERVAPQRGDAAPVGQALAPGARRDEGGAGDPLDDEGGVLLAEREHRHAAHRVADEDEVAGRHELVDDRAQVLAEALDGVAVATTAARLAVPALVPADDAVASRLERAPLVDPAPQAEAVAMGQDDRRQLVGAAPAGGPLGRGGGHVRVGHVDLAVQRDAVGRQHDVLLVGHDVEQLRRLERGHRRPVLAGAVGSDAGSDTGSHAERGCRDADDGVATGTGGHALPSAPMWIRGTRGPSRVTIS